MPLLLLRSIESTTHFRVLVAHPSIPAKNVKERVAVAKAEFWGLTIRARERVPVSCGLKEESIRSPCRKRLNGCG